MIPAALDERLLAQFRSIVGDDGVISNPQELVVYECDAYTIEKNLPSVVVLPRTTQETAEIVGGEALHALGRPENRSTQGLIGEGCVLHQGAWIRDSRWTWFCRPTNASGRRT